MVEVNEAGTERRRLWNFTTQEFSPIDDLESYKDDDSRIYDRWIDGITAQASGSTVGYMLPPFAEKTIVHSGKQSMPMKYNNGNSPY